MKAPAQASIENSRLSVAIVPQFYFFIPTRLRIGFYFATLG